MNFLKASLAIAAICIAQTSYAQAERPASTTAQVNGHTLTYQYIYDEVTVEDPETGEQTVKLVRSERIDMLDGDKIFYKDGASEPVGAAAQSTLDAFLKDFLAEEIRNYNKKYSGFGCMIIIDAKGKFAYLKSFTSTQTEAESKEMAARFSEVEKKLQSINFIPAKKDGKAVSYGLAISDYM